MAATTLANGLETGAATAHGIQIVGATLSHKAPTDGSASGFAVDANAATIVGAASVSSTAVVATTVTSTALVADTFTLDNTALTVAAMTGGTTVSSGSEPP